jgi:origin recognition complex subunit 6
MDTTIVERAMISLVPTINGPPPRELVQLATALLAQSRSKASNLKRDEEIARAYACAHLACERCVVCHGVFVVFFFHLIFTIF